MPNYVTAGGNNSIRDQQSHLWAQGIYQIGGVADSARNRLCCFETTPIIQVSTAQQPHSRDIFINQNILSLVKLIKQQEGILTNSYWYKQEGILTNSYWHKQQEGILTNSYWYKQQEGIITNSYWYKQQEGILTNSYWYK